MHKKIFRLRFLLVVCIIIMIVLTGCGTKNNLIGVWESEQGESIEFFKDGSLVISSSFFSASGTYSIVDKNRIRLTLDGLWGIAGSQVIDYEVSGKRLLLGGETYKKVR